MKIGLTLALLFVGPALAPAATIAARDLPAGTVIGSGDVTWDDTKPGGIADPETAIGMQARVAIYAGRPVTAGALRTPVLVSRNQIVRVAFDSGTLRIETEGRAMTEGAAGDIVRVMNLSSRSTISAIVAEDGTLRATNSHMEMK